MTSAAEGPVVILLQDFSVSEPCMDGWSLSSSSRSEHKEPDCLSPLMAGSYSYPLPVKSLLTVVLESVVLNFLTLTVGLSVSVQFVGVCVTVRSSVI